MVSIPKNTETCCSSTWKEKGKKKKRDRLHWQSPKDFGGSCLVVCPYVRDSCTRVLIVFAVWHLAGAMCGRPGVESGERSRWWCTRTWLGLLWAGWWWWVQGAVLFFSCLGGGRGKRHVCFSKPQNMLSLMPRIGSLKREIWATKTCFGWEETDIC